MLKKISFFIFFIWFFSVNILFYAYPSNIETIINLTINNNTDTPFDITVYYNESDNEKFSINPKESIDFKIDQEIAVTLKNENNKIYYLNVDTPSKTVRLHRIITNVKNSAHWPRLKSIQYQEIPANIILDFNNTDLLHSTFRLDKQ
jgi:hypothetical protein